MDERFKTHSEVGHVYSMYSKIIFFVYTWFASAREKKTPKNKTGSGMISTRRYLSKFAKKLGAFLLYC